jgi:hypothetical protein
MPISDLSSKAVPPISSEAMPPISPTCPTCGKEMRLTGELLAKLRTECGPRNVFARDVAVSGSLSWHSLPNWSIFPDVRRVDAAAVAAAV